MTHRLRRPRRTALGIALAAGALAHPASTFGGPIHSDAAFTPRRGGSILRLQYSYTEADGADNNSHANNSGARATFVYGVTEKIAAFLSVPYNHRRIDRHHRKLGGLETKDSGVGDVTVMTKVRFWQRDVRAQETWRLAALFGLNIRSGDSDFSSDSYDPILGSIFTFRRDRHLFDVDLIYQINTGGGTRGHDRLRYDLAYSYRLFPALFETGNLYEWNVVAELNGGYTTDGKHECFVSPGLQFVTPRYALEGSLQVPVIQELKDDALETDYRFVVGVRLRW